MIVAVFVAGLAISTIAIFSGIGGGVLWTPFLISIVGMPPDQAVATALTIQLAGMASGSVENQRQKHISWELVRQHAVVGAPMALVGVAVCRTAVPQLIELCLGVLIFVIAYLFLSGDGLWEPGSAAADLGAGKRIRIVSAIGGFFTGFLSIGIGDWLVPLFNRKCGLTMVRAIATGVALMLFLSGTSAAAHFALGAPIDWSVLAGATPGVVIGAQIGSRLHRRIPEHSLKEAFVLLLVFLAAHVTFNAI